MSDESQAVARLKEYAQEGRMWNYEHARAADIRTVLDALDACRAEWDALRKDSAMLDWLEKHATFIEVGHGDIGTSRADIDAAMKEKI
jgi:hypothetical protein